MKMFPNSSTAPARWGENVSISGSGTTGMVSIDLLLLLPQFVISDFESEAGNQCEPSQKYLELLGKNA
jgi:hypothetical protein